MEAFFRTPLAARRNAVKVWRPVPQGLWTTLDRHADLAWSTRRERAAVAAVGLLIVVIALTSGWRRTLESKGQVREFPAFGAGCVAWPGEATGAGGGSSPTVTEFAPAGWSYRPWQAAMPLAWTVCPPILGWLLVRALWIPAATRGRFHQPAAMNAARLLSGVYLYVYLMIGAGAFLNAVLTWLAPQATDRWRWWLWLFLFGESFFVPAVTWVRLVRADRTGDAFGPNRRAWVTLYAGLCVAIPLAGMGWHVAR
ncbi:MAG: hypothetical protein C4547_13215 [Phycisphaerales bacterium]|nr:MAG: hypothetical protein C4547_13215 [Phycisphaerales bacterium]